MQECVRARPGIASRREPPVTRGGIAAALTLIALQIVAVHAIPTRLWGLSAAAFAPRWMEPVLVVFALALLVPRVARAAADRAAHAWSRLADHPPRRHPRIAAVAAAGFVVFLALRSRNGFFGDGFLRIEQLAAGKPALPSAGSLDILVHHGIWRLLAAAGFSDAALGYALVSAAAGAVAVALMPALSRRLVPDPAARWMVPALLLSMGSVQLFFGYAEDYTLRELAAIAYFLAALAALQGGSPRPALIILAAGAACHLTLLALAPSAVALFIGGRRAGRRDLADSGPPRARGRHRWRLAGGLALAAGLASVALFYLRRQYGGLGALVPPVAGPQDAYGWFSPAHLLDLLNFTLLIAPLAPALLAVSLLSSRGAETRTVFRRRLEALDRETLFWTLAGAGVLAGAFLLDPKLGSRDWDLMSFGGVPLMLIAIRVAARHPRASATVTATLAGAALLHVVPWIAVNHDRSRSADLVESMVQEDPHYSSGPTPRFMNLGVIYERQGLTDYSFRLHQRAVRARPDNALAHFNLGTALLEKGRTDEAARELERAVAINPREAQARAQLGVAYGMQGRIAESLRELRDAVDLAPGSAEAWLDLGVSYLHAGLPESTAVAWEKLLAMTPANGPLHLRLAGVYRDMGAIDRARAHAREAVRLNPGDRAARDLLASLEAPGDGSGAGVVTGAGRPAQTSPRQP